MGARDRLVDAAASLMHEAGRLRTDLDVDAVAAAVIAHMEGLMVMTKANRDPDVLAGLGATARCLVA